jgi:hypothetical protein
MPTREDAPLLEGWVSLADAAERLGYTRQGAHYLADTGIFATLCRVPGDRTLYVLREAELPEVARARGLVELTGLGTPLARRRWRQPTLAEQRQSRTTADPKARKEPAA